MLMVFREDAMWKRGILIAAVALGTGFVLGALTYRHYLLTKYFRKPPAETRERPHIPGPAT